MDNGSGVGRQGRRWAYILLFIPLIVMLWVPFYQPAAPYFNGIPYFYWFMFLWVPITAIITAIVYAITG